MNVSPHSTTRAAPSLSTLVAFPTAEEWACHRLPELNRAILAGTIPPETLIDELTRDVFRKAPMAWKLSDRQAQQWVVYLGLFGSSVARHLQEREPLLKEWPARSFERMTIGNGLPFLDYMTLIAQRTQAGHPSRDTYCSFVRWNAPTVKVIWDGTMLGMLPGVFASDAIRTYTNTEEEALFIALLKKAEALELVANDLLLPVIQGLTAIDSKDARERLVVCATLLSAVHQLNLEFTVRNNDGQPVFTANHFMDVLRQFAVHWRNGDTPPSGAQDPEFLKRDFYLGTTTARYPEHVRRIFPGLLEAERQALEHAMDLPSLTSAVNRRLVAPEGVARTLAEKEPADLLCVAQEQPWLVPIYLLLRAHARVSASHLMLTKKFLFNPMRVREGAGIPDAVLVTNRAGTTGLIEQQLEALHKVRAEHALAAFDKVPREELLRIGNIPPMKHSRDELLDLVHFALGPRA